MVSCILSRGVLLTMIALFAIFRAGEAQSSNVEKSRQNAVAISHLTQSDSAAAIWAKSDTGRMMPGYRDLSAYDRPSYCIAALQGMEELTWRKGEVDTLAKGTVSDTLPTAVTNIGRSCIAKMTPQTVPPAELYNLARLAIRVGDTAFARRTIEYHVSITRNDARERGYVLADAIAEAARSRPIRSAFIESLLPQFATLDATATEAGAWAYSIAYSAAHTRFDTTAMLRFSHAREALLRRLTPEERKAQVLTAGKVYEDSLDIVWYQSVPELSPTVKHLGDEWATAGGFLDSDFAQGMIAMASAAATIPGQSPPQLQVFKQYPADASLTPVPGRVTIVMPILQMGNGHLDAISAYLRRMHERYHNRGLDIVLVGKIKGYAWASPPLEAEDEAKLIGWYYREHLKLPFTIMVEETSFSQKPDGRKIGSLSLLQQTFRPIPLRGYIVGRDGTMKSINYGFHSESELEAYILRELSAASRQASAPPSTSASAADSTRATSR